jgi:hypothetical protein
VAQTVFDLGDPVTSRLSLGVTPDGTTGATLIILKPDGSTLSPAPAVTGPAGQDYIATFTASAPGDWVAIWTVTGTGSGVQAKVYNVRTLPGPSDTRPVWSPFLSAVGDYIPSKTRDITPGSDVIFGTFNGLTHPDDGQVQRMLDNAVTGILSRITSVAPSMWDQAGAVAALRAAADIELAWPDRSSDLTLYTALSARYEAEFCKLDDLSSAALPSWSMPDAPNWKDDLQMWL